MSPTNMPLLWTRGLSADLNNAKSTLSSWDKCMSKAYCKWPVIAAIIIGSVIVIAILACVINCVCLGYQCCTCCCSCFSCCCPSGRRRNKSPKYYDDPTFNNPHGATPYDQPTRPAPPVYRGAVTTATFDSSKGPSSTVNDDALPEMPTWATAVDKHVEDDHHRDDVEMEPLNALGHPDRKGAGTPMHSGSAYSDFPPDRGTTPLSGYRGFGPTDPYARRSPAPAALAATQDPYGRRSPGIVPPGPAMDPYGRRSPGPTAAYNATPDPYGRRSPGPGAAFATPHDPYSGAPRSPGLTSPVGPAGPYDQHSAYDHQAYASPYEDYSPGGAVPSPLNAGPPAGYRGLTSPSPVAAYKPPTTYSPAPMPFAGSPASPGPDMHQQQQAPGFQRQPSFGSSQYPPTYVSRVMSPGVPATPPPPFQSQPPSEFGGHDPSIGMALSSPPPDSSRNRPPSLLQSGRQPAPNSFRNV